MSMIVSLILTGKNINPEEITNNLNIVPSKIWGLGEKISAINLTYQNDGWSFSLPESETLDFNEELKKLFDQVKGKEHKI